MEALNAETIEPERRTTRRGCLRPQLSHGLSYTPEYRAWQLMRLRCTDPKHKAYPRYGGRGITLCAEWLDSPSAFIAHIGPKPTPKHEVDRIDNERGYEPGNVRWATRKENDRNRRNNHIIELHGERLTLVEWAERTGLRADTIGDRLRSGWSPERALTTPSRAWNRRPFGPPPPPRSNSGERNGGAKLKIEDVRRVRALAAEGKSTAEIAKEVPAASKAIRRIINGTRWGSVS